MSELDLDAIQARADAAMNLEGETDAYVVTARWHASAKDVPVLVAELRVAREALRVAPRPPRFNTNTHEYVVALAAYDQFNQGGDAHAGDRGVHVTGPAVDGDDTAGPNNDAPARCQCGHAEAEHMGPDRWCDTCGLMWQNGVGHPTGKCMGWEPLDDLQRTVREAALYVWARSQSPADGPVDMQEAIEAATKALGEFKGAMSTPAAGARAAVEAAWPYAEGVISYARAKVDRQRAENARMHRAVEDMKASHRERTEQLAYLAQQVERLKQTARTLLNASSYTEHEAAKQTLRELVSS